MISSGYPDLNYFLDKRGRLHVYLGPMGLVITARKEGLNVFDNKYIVERTVKKAVKTLEEVSSMKKLVYGFVSEKNSIDDLPRVVKLMVNSSRAISRISGEMLTPMASVAGSIAEVMLGYLEDEAGADEIIVNNYGDIAMKIREADIGLRDGRGEFYGKLRLDGGMYGICTSGFGGRSFTRGIADGVTCVCESASIADACATAVGNSVITESGEIVKAMAESIYPDTDIPGMEVVVQVGDLDEGEIRDAIRNGLEMAERLDVTAIIKLRNFVAFRNIEKNRIRIKKRFNVLY